MVRARGVARKSFARRRVRRVKKYDHNVIPVRFKKYLPHMADLLKPKLDTHVLCEQPTMDLLKDLGVPTDEWQYYLGFMKRMITLYQNFTEETLASEKQSLIAEYVLRGKTESVLEQVQGVAEGCAGIVVSCSEVKACLEGDYTAYANLWTNLVPDGLNSEDTIAFFILESMEYFVMGWRDSPANDDRFAVYKLSDMSVIFQSPAGTDYLDEAPDINRMRAIHIGQTARSFYGGIAASRTRYLALQREDEHTIEIWKDGALLQSINAQDYVANCHVFALHFSLNGKYLLIGAFDEVASLYYIVCFEGS